MQFLFQIHMYVKYIYICKREYIYSIYAQAGCGICMLMVLMYVALTMCETHWAAVENSCCDFYIALSQ